MANTIGTDAGSLTASTGGVVNIDGQPLLAADNAGSTSRILGQALQREILDGVANGDFSFPPTDAGAAISDDTNPLPYWSYTGATGFTATIANESTYSANGNALLISVGTTAVAGTYATLSRYVPISNSGNRNYCYGTELFGFGETGTLANLGKQKVSLSCTAVDKDYAALTVTDTGFEVLGTGGANFTTGTGDKSPDARAAFLLITLKFELITSAVSATTSYRIGEVRLNRGQPQYALSDLGTPDNSPWFITNDAGNFDIRSDSVNTWINLTNDSETSMYTMYLEATDGLGNGDIFIEAGSTLNLISGNSVIPAGEIILRAGTTVDVEAPSGVTITTDGTTLGTLYASVIDAATIRSDNTTTSDLVLQATGSDVYIQDTNVANGTNPRILFRDKSNTFYAGIKSGAANIVQILNGSSTTDYAYLWAERIYPMNGSTDSRYIFDNGSATAFSGAVLTGTLTSTGVISGNNFTADTITGTTATTNAAIWVLTAGTTYNLRRNTSSARYKTDITDVDQVVIDAAKRIKPRHFTSTIPDEAGATRLGFIAEEVEAAGLTHAVGYDVEGRVDTIDSVGLIAALYARVEDLEKRVEALAPTPLVRYATDVPKSSITD
jgi:hypothetical protein